MRSWIPQSGIVQPLPLIGSASLNHWTWEVPDDARLNCVNAFGTRGFSRAFPRNSFPPLRGGPLVPKHAASRNKASHPGSVHPGRKGHTAEFGSVGISVINTERLWFPAVPKSRSLKVGNIKLLGILRQSSSTSRDCSTPSEAVTKACLEC